MPELNFNGSSVSYEVVRCARKTLGVVVSPDGTVMVRVPYHTNHARIFEFAERLKPWIFKHLARYEQARASNDFTSGEKLPYLGKKYRLVVVPADNEAAPIITGGQLRVPVPRGLSETMRRELVKESLIKWYEVQAHQILTERLGKLALSLGLCPAAVKVKRQVRRWGSCTARGVINLNWRLVMAPPEVIDYVIIHELCHLMVQGHQGEFWEYVARHLPDYKKHKKWLRVNSLALSMFG